MDYAALYFSRSGRIGRKAWWIGMFPLAILAVLLPDTLYVLLSWSIRPLAILPGPLWIASWGLTALLVLHPVLAMFIKRLHDLPRSGWWAFFVLQPPFVGMALHALDVPVYGLIDSSIGRTLLYLYLAVSLWLLGEMAFRHGQPGPNKYGPPPGPSGGSDG